MEIGDYLASAVGACAFIYITNWLSTTKQRYYFKHGISGTAQITALEETPVIYNDDSPVYQIHLIIKSEARICVIKQPFSYYNHPENGDVVNILIHPKNRDRALIVSNLSNGKVYLR
ncbi:hypothetical protein [Mucilaginibacter terrae]|uniref:DUF3592 domain-containing protein n=1 Tax=Mucilaginibacter terrae TaxID=1955052 RepID=A0ABU3GS18_9SPHI|nr:hypothetical protein [Mucilaginibacter terrae]MDT3402569.1 hypothetical protein [Mucilaginibacter terrae]